jgi:hypothetical protein
MTQTVPLSADAVAAELEKILSVLNAAHRFVAEERLIDLAALEGRVHAACEAAMALPRADARPLAAALESVLAQLDSLAVALQERFGDLPVFPSHKAGTAAYADALKHFP